MPEERKKGKLDPVNAAELAIGGKHEEISLDALKDLNPAKHRKKLLNVVNKTKHKQVASEALKMIGNKLSPEEATKIAINCSHSNTAMSALASLDARKNFQNVFKIAFDSQHENVASQALEMLRNARSIHPDIPDEIDGIKLGTADRCLYLLGRGKNFEHPHEEAITFVRRNWKKNKDF